MSRPYGTGMGRGVYVLICSRFRLLPDLVGRKPASNVFFDCADHELSEFGVVSGRLAVVDVVSRGWTTCFSNVL
jgi:hypothetical protein